MHINNFFITKGYGIIIDPFIAEMYFHDETWCKENDIDIDEGKQFILKLINSCLTLVPEEKKEEFLLEYNNLEDLSGVNDFGRLFDSLGYAISHNDERWTYYLQVCGPDGVANEEGRFLGVKVNNVDVHDLLNILFQGKTVETEAPSENQRDLVDETFGWCEPKEMLVAPDCVCCH